MKKILATLALIAFTLPAHSATLKGGYAACLTEKLLDQMTKAAVRKDERGMKYLLDNGCIITREGIEISVLDMTWSGKVHVRAYAGNQALELWTVTENVID